MVSKIVVCLSLTIAVASAASFMGMLPMKPKELAHKQGCYIREIDDVINFGDEVTLIGSCYRIECSRHRIYYDTCSTVSTDDPKCYVTDTDLSRPYPSCCPDVQCDIDNTI